MAWGGPAGAGMGGGSAVGQSAAAGLPFAGVPAELAERVEAVLDAEPEHPEHEPAPHRGSALLGFARGR